MKTKYLLYLFLSFILMFSCNDKEIKEANNLISVNESKLDKQQQKAIESVREFLLGQRKELARSQEGLPENCLKPEELEKVSFSTISYYKLDTSFLSSDLDHDHLDKYIKPMLDNPMFLGKLGDDYALMMNVQNVGENRWIPDFNIEGIEYFQRVFSWLIPEINVSSKKEFYILRVFGLNYIVYYSKEGGPVYCNFPGNIRMNKVEFFEHVIDRYNSINDMKEMVKNWGKTEKK